LLTFHRAHCGPQRARLVCRYRTVEARLDVAFDFSANINFLGKGFIACMVSLALLLAGAFAFYKRGDRNLASIFAVVT